MTENSTQMMMMNERQANIAVLPGQHTSSTGEYNEANGLRSSIHEEGSAELNAHDSIYEAEGE